MPTDVQNLFKEEPLGEIVVIKPEEREQFLKEAETFVVEKFAAKLALSGGNLPNIDSTMVVSLMEKFVRSEGMNYTKGPLVEISIDTYRDALAKFKEFIENAFQNYDLLREFWFSQVKICVSNLFEKSERVFEPYIIGDLCENLCINNEQALFVVRELESQGFIKMIGKQYKQKMFSRVS
jgi:hypothetical protein